MTLQVVSACSGHPVAAEAFAECAGSVLEASTRIAAAPDLLAVACTAAIHGSLHDLVSSFEQLLGPRTSIGAVTTGVHGGGRTIDDAAALSVLALWGRRCTTFHLPGAAGGDPAADGAGLAAALDRLRSEADAGAPSLTLLLADPFSWPLSGIGAELERSTVRSTVLAGAVGAGARAGANRLVHDGVVVDHGAVGVVVEAGDARIDTASGCDWIGPAATITASSAGLVSEVDGAPAINHVARVLAPLSEAERERALAALVLAVAPDGRSSAFAAGLARTSRVLAVDGRGLTLDVPDSLSPGAVCRLGCRDGASLRHELATGVPRAPGGAAFILSDVDRVSVPAPDDEAGLIAEVTGASATWGVRTSATVATVVGVPRPLAPGAVAVGVVR